MADPAPAAAVPTDRSLRLSPACAQVILNVNGDPARYAWYGLPVIPDRVPIARSSRAISSRACTNLPGLPKMTSPPIFDWHPVVGLWPVALRGELRAALENEGLSLDAQREACEAFIASQKREG